MLREQHHLECTNALPIHLARLDRLASNLNTEVVGNRPTTCTVSSFPLSWCLQESDGLSGAPLSPVSVSATGVGVKQSWQNLLPL